MMEASVKEQVKNLARSNTVQEVWNGFERDVYIHGMVYELRTGLLRDLGVTVSRDNAYVAGM